MGKNNRGSERLSNLLEVAQQVSLEPRVQSQVSPAAVPGLVNLEGDREASVLSP